MRREERGERREERGEKQRENEKQMKRKVQDHRLYTLQERVGSLRSQLSFKQVNEEEWKEEKECEEIRKAWLKDYPQVFKEDLSKEDRIQMDPVVVELVPDHENIEVYHPKACNEVPAYLKNAADKELKRMLEGGLLEPVHEYSPIVSRGFFVEKNTAPGEEVKVRLVADFRGVNQKLQRPEYPLDNSWGILKRLNPNHRFFSAINFSSGYSQIPLAEECRDMFTILLPQGKFRYTVLPQGLSVSPELFDISTAPEIRNTRDCWKNADDILGGGTSLRALDIVM